VGNAQIPHSVMEAFTKLTTKTLLMSTNADVPSFRCKLKKEFLYDLQSHHGEFVDCIVFGVSAHIGQTLLYFCLIDGGAVWECLPISAFVHKEEAPEWNLEHYQPYDCFSDSVSTFEFARLKGKSVKVRANGSWHEGEYMFTVDWNEYPDVETFKKKNALHIIKLENGLFVAQPNNRILWHDDDLSFDESKRDYKPMQRSWKAN